jgi:MoxR-like ATPase
MENTIFEPRVELSEINQFVRLIKEQIGTIIVGQDNLINLVVAAILADGHVLIEGVPGVAKTLTAKLVAKTLSVGYSRIQFTPDLMPSDVLGTTVYNQQTSAFSFKKGPVFSNLILIDEINRASAKTQSALFEVMEEKQVTVDGITYPMELPFIVLATQNPLEQEGTYRLPEAQMDRFLFKIDVTYPELEDEIAIINGFQARNGQTNLETVTPVVTAQELLRYREIVSKVFIDEKLCRYIAQIVVSTRNNPSLYLGASPRASLSIVRGSKAIAAMKGRDFVTPEDIKEILNAVLNHRIMLSAEKEMEGIRPQQVIEQIVKSIEVPK